MLFREVTPSGFRGAMIGLVEGTLAVAGVLGGWHLFSGTSLDLLVVAALSLAGGVALSLGRGLSGRMFGAGAGAVLGVLVFLPLALLMPESWDIEKPRGEPGSFVLAGPTLDGKQLDIADYRGKLVLVDFWATWCPPCVGELPNVLDTYERYHDRGFEVIAVSLDQDRDALAGFVRKHHLPWPQVFYGGDGGKNPLAIRYRVDGIPATFLIGRDGNLITTNLRGGDLAREVERYLDHDPVIPVRLYLGVGCGLLLGSLLGAIAQRLSAGPPGQIP